MNRVPPVTLCGGGTGVCQPEGPIAAEIGRSVGTTFSRALARHDLPICQECERQHGEADQSVDKELCRSAGIADDRKRSSSNLINDGDQLLCNAVEERRSMNITELRSGQKSRRDGHG